MSEIKNTYIEFELEDGSKVNMTLNFYMLYLLKSKNKTIYDKYNKVMIKGPQEELDNVTVLYAAYLCANIDKSEKIMSEIEFMQALSSNRESMNVALEALTKGKKK